MKVTSTEIPDLLIVEPKVFGDSRGFFLETYQEKKYKELGISAKFVQDNLSFSSKGVLRGLHIQKNFPQGKLVQVIQGEVFDVAVDMRPISPYFKKWVGVFLSDKNKKQFWIPAGFAHGFVVISDTALFSYKCTDYYYPQHEVAIKWDDPDIGITWPVTAPLVSDKDKAGVFVKDLDLKQVNKSRWGDYQSAYVGY